ncbi:MAG TPA: cytochrome c oxidase subunit II [Anaeromyxobacteraceae bacterium]|nr:cytochrome c oxidase subunit II [Anaeromyxobacteraceae bacterium]
MLPTASNLAASVDRVFLYIVALSAIVLVGITAAMVLFVVRYRRSRRPQAEQIEGNTWLEVTWTTVPTLLFLSMFFYGWSVWHGGRVGPAGVPTVKVTGRQFAWAFTYPGGKTTSQLILPLGRPVRLDVVSDDVIHGFFVPAFRVKVDAVPGRTNYTYLTPTEEGAYDVECTSLCGTGHTYMLSKVHVVKPGLYDEWAASPSVEPPGPGGILVAAAPATPEERGKALYAAKGCNACHSTDGAAGVGPTFKGLWGRRETLETGQQITVDEPYVVRSIKTPAADVVKGFPNAMPPLPLTDAELRDLVAWLKTLR